MLSMGLPFSQIHKATGISMGTLSNMKNNPLVWGHAQWASLSHPHGGGGDHGQEVGNACGGAHGSGLDCVSLDRRGHCRKLKPLWLREARDGAPVQGGQRAFDGV